MHGLFGSKQNWKSICKALNLKSIPQRKVIALDARNHGESPHASSHTYTDLAEDVRHFFEQHDIRNAICIGHSMGGRAMMCFALQYPELVDRAIIVDVSPVRSSPSLLSMGEIFAAMTKVDIPITFKMSEGRELANQQLMDAIPSKETRDFVLMNLVKGTDGRFGWRANVSALHQNFKEHIAKFPESLAGKQFAGPVLFLAGSRSDYIREDELPEIKKIFPNSDLKFIDSGHLVHVEKPHEF
ncbi:Protein ABHD11, partial [Pseudolycoriella hygida]